MINFYDYFIFIFYFEKEKRKQNLFVLWIFLSYFLIDSLKWNRWLVKNSNRGWSYKLLYRLKNECCPGTIRNWSHARGKNERKWGKGKRNKGKWSRVSRYPRRVPFAFWEFINIREEKRERCISSGNFFTIFRRDMRKRDTRST